MFRHIQAASHIVLDSTTKGILICLCHHANEFTCRCWPSLERIQEFTGFKRRAVQMAIQKLVDLKLIVIVKRGGNRMASTYLVTIPGEDPISQTHSASDDKTGAEFDREADSDGRVHGASDDIQGASGDQKRASDAPQESSNNGRERETRASPLVVVKCIVPADWWPTPERFAEAERKYTDVDVQTETERFVSVNRGRGTEIHDLDSAWWAWVGNGRRFAERDRKTGPKRRGHHADPSSADFLRRKGSDVYREGGEEPALISIGRTAQ